MKAESIAREDAAFCAYVAGAQMTDATTRVISRRACREPRIKGFGPL
jgi:hypothetical protein